MNAAIRAWVLAVVLLVVAACATSSPGPVIRPVENYGAAAVCGTVLADPETGHPVRAESESCPSGYVEVPGHPYRWYFVDWNGDIDLDIVYVGEPLPPTYVPTRPTRVQTVNIYNGAPRDRASAEAACGCSSPRGARVPQRSRQAVARDAGPSAGGAVAVAAPASRGAQRADSPSITRGGLGVPNSRASNAPAPRVSPPAPREVRTAAPATARRPGK